VDLTHRLATLADLATLAEVMDAAIAELQRPFLSVEQIESSRLIMGIDTQLVKDGTYYVVEGDGHLAGCGGWSRRATLYGGDQTPDRDPELLDPGVDAARVRAMYTHPVFVRRGVGRLILTLCELAAADSGSSSSWARWRGSRSTRRTGSWPWSGSRTSEGALRCRWSGWSRTSRPRPYDPGMSDPRPSRPGAAARTVEARRGMEESWCSQPRCWS